MHASKGLAPPRSKFDYSCVSDAVSGIPSFYQTSERLKELAGSVHGSWLYQGLKEERRACHHFEKCGFITYDVLHTKLGVSFPFIDFKLSVFRHLKVAPTQLHPRSEAFIKVLQFWNEYMG